MDKEKVKEFLSNAVKKIKTEEDPKELNEYRKVFRENVSFSLRSYFAAYMLKAAMEGRAHGAEPAAKERHGYSERGAERRARQSEPQHGPRAPIPVLSEDEAASIFIGIGRKRKVFPKDIIYLIMQNSGIERSHIGEIKILDNYSFVQIMTSDAQKVIDALSGVEYRGKKLAVSFARKGDEYAAPQAAGAEDTASFAESPAESEAFTEAKSD